MNIKKNAQVKAPLVIDYVGMSDLQKAFRVGDVEHSARRLRSLWDLNAQQLRFRIATIVLEDAGVRGLDWATPYLETDLKQGNFEDKGWLKYENLEKWWLEGVALPKDRTGCDIASKARHQNSQEVLSKLKSAPMIQDWIQAFGVPVRGHKIEENALRVLGEYLLEGLNQEPDLAPWEKGWLLWSLCSGVKRQKHPENWDLGVKGLELAQQYIEQETHSKRAQMLIRLMGILSEPMALGCAVALVALETETERPLEVNAGARVGDSIVEAALLPGVYIERIGLSGKKELLLPSALDKHTREGYAVLRRLVQQKVLPLRGDTVEENVEYWGRIVFRAEGQRVNSRIWYPTARKVYQNASYYNANGVDIRADLKYVQERLASDFLRERIEILKPLNNNKPVGFKP